MKSKLLEDLAELEHEQWMKWSKEIAKCLDLSRYENMERLQRWKKLWVPYSQLNEDMKEEDRKWARKILALIEEYQNAVDY